MTEQGKYDDWVDRYVRDELSEEEVEEFEERLMTDSDLQGQLEAVLLMKEALKLGNESEADAAKDAVAIPWRNQWSPMAIAASVLLAVVSTTLYWRSNVEIGHLQDQVAALQAPRTSVLTVPVDIMRSAGSATPDVIVELPAGHGAIVLDIELSPRFRNLQTVDFELLTQDSEAVLGWTAAPAGSDTIKVVLDSEVVPAGMIQLRMSDPDSDKQESRLLEFRRPGGR